MVFDPPAPRTLLLAVPLAMAMLVLTLAGCGVSKQSQGVVNQWRDASLPPFERGITTQSEVIERLGPPSQVIGLNDQIVFYYLRENVASKGVFLILFNWTSKRVSYDRAIFFFNKDGLLTEYGISVERLPYEKSPS